MLAVWTISAALAAAPAWDALRAEEGWEEVATKATEFGEVRVLHRTIDEANCLQGVLTTTVPVERIVEVLLDVPSAVKWSSASLVYSDVVEELPGGEVVLMQYIDVPNWTLVADRFWIVRSGVKVLPDGERRYTWERVPADRHPTVRDKAQAWAGKAIEPPVNWGEWMFRPSGGALQVRYRGCSDIGGAIPDWLQKLVASRTLPDTVADLVREARKRGGG